MVDPSFSGVIVVRSGDVLNPILLITMVIKVYKRIRVME